MSTSDIFSPERREQLRHKGTKSQAQVILSREMMMELCAKWGIKPARRHDWLALGGVGERPACADHCQALVEHNPEQPRTYRDKPWGVMAHIYSIGQSPEERHADARADAAAVGLAWMPLPWSVYDPDLCISGVFVKIPHAALAK